MSATRPQKHALPADDSQLLPVHRPPSDAGHGLGEAAWRPHQGPALLKQQAHGMEGKVN